MSGPATRAPRSLRVFFHETWSAPEGQGLLSPDPRVRTIRKVLVTYPEVRHIVPDRISLDAHVDARTLESMAAFLQRQHWLVKAVVVE